MNLGSDPGIRATPKGKGASQDSLISSYNKGIYCNPSTPKHLYLGIFIIQ